MTVDQFIQRIERLTSSVETNTENNMWQYGIERLLEDLRARLAGTDLANNLGYAIEGDLVAILAPDYLLYQNYGVAGEEGNQRGAVEDEFEGRIHKYGTKMPPPSVFARYTSDTSHQFAIAKTIQKYGIAPKSWFTKDELERAYTQYVEDFIREQL